MQVGDVVMTKKFARFARNEIVESTVNYAAPKKTAFVFLCLGIRDLAADAQPFDAEAVLEAMGWKFVGDASAPAASDEDAQ